MSHTTPWRGTMTYTLIGPDSEAKIEVGEGDMIVYDVCKIKDYQGGDYVPHKAKEMPFHMLKEMLYPKETDDGG
jgi:hypothetical protein